MRTYTIPSSNPEEPVHVLTDVRCTTCRRVWPVKIGYPVGRCACGTRDYEAVA